MPLSSREQRMLDLLESRGVPIDRAALTRKFNFVVSPITTNLAEVKVPAEIARSITASAESRHWSCELSAIVVFPIIAGSTIYARPNFVTHKRSSKAYYVGKNIDFHQWQRARRPGRIKLTLENFNSSILTIPDRHLSSSSKGELLEFVAAAGAKATNAR